VHRRAKEWIEAKAVILNGDFLPRLPPQKLEKSVVDLTISSTAFKPFKAKLFHYFQ
jgi:hypothetical protein